MRTKTEFDRNPGLFKDIAALLWQSRKWYLIPVVGVIALLGVLVVLSGTAAAPFIYTLF
jgi:hypothetical protein